MKTHAPAVILLVAVTLTRCVSPSTTPEPEQLSTGAPSATPSAAPTDGPTETFRPTETLETLASRLTTPWSVIPLATGSMLISERDTARVLEITADGDTRLVGVVPGVVPGGEGGLLGIAARDTGTPYLYVYFTTAGDNRIARIEVTGAPGSYELGAIEILLTGIPKARSHNGGRLVFGPDGMLYATAGDARLVDEAQNIR